MSKLTKLIKKPHLYVYHGLKNTIYGKSAAVLDGSALWSRYKDDNYFLDNAQQMARCRECIFGVENPSASAAGQYVKKLWAVKGMAALGEMKALLALAQKYRFHNLPRLQIFYAAAQIEAGFSPDPSFVKTLQSDVSASLALGDFAYRFFDMKRFGLYKEAMNLTYESEGYIEMLLKSGKSIAIVGNSPNQIGRKQGAEIDAHDVIIRFNNYNTEPDYAVDYGVKTTIWMRANNYSDIWRRPLSEYDAVIFSGPDARYHALTPYTIIESAMRGRNSCFVPTRIYCEVAQKLNYNPSAGLLMLYWVKSVCGSVRRGHVDLYGFSMDDQQPFKSQQYFSCLLRKEKYSHNWGAEAAFLKELVHTAQ